MSCPAAFSATTTCRASLHASTASASAPSAARATPSPTRSSAPSGRAGAFLAQASIAPAICWLLILVLFGLGAIDPRLREIAYIITFIPLLLGAFAGIVLAGYYTGAPRPRRPHAILLLASAQAGVISIELAGLAVLWF